MMKEREVMTGNKGIGEELKKMTAEKGDMSIPAKEDKVLTAGDSKIIEDHRIMTADGAEMIEVSKYFLLRFLTLQSASLVTYKLSL
jgi:hypothetical protein